MCMLARNCGIGRPGSGISVGSMLAGISIEVGLTNSDPVLGGGRVAVTVFISSCLLVCCKIVPTCPSCFNWPPGTLQNCRDPFYIGIEIY